MNNTNQQISGQYKAGLILSLIGASIALPAELLMFIFAFISVELVFLIVMSLIGGIGMIFSITMIVLLSKALKDKNYDKKILLGVLSIIFTGILGIIGGIMMLSTNTGNMNSQQVINQKAVSQSGSKVKSNQQNTVVQSDGTFRGGIITSLVMAVISFFAIAVLFSLAVIGSLELSPAALIIATLFGIIGIGITIVLIVMLSICLRRNNVSRRNNLQLN